MSLWVGESLTPTLLLRRGEAMPILEKHILNKTTKHNERYTLIKDGRGMGGYGKPDDHYLNNWYIATGLNHPVSGYNGFMAIDYFLGLGYVPEEVKRKVRHDHNLNIPQSEIWGKK